jgi:hypothetical protein
VGTSQQRGRCHHYFSLREALVQKSEQPKIRNSGILAAITFAVLGTLSSCDSLTPTEVAPPSAEAQFDDTEGPRCILINGQIYCN